MFFLSLGNSWLLKFGIRLDFFFVISLTGRCDFWHIYLLNISMMGLHGKFSLEIKKYHFQK